MRSLVMTIGLVLLTTSCATTRVVQKRHQKSGVIMVKDGIIGDARADAKKLMADNCGRKRPVVVEEGEAVVGSTTDGRERKSVLFKGVSYGSSETRNVTEWQLKYVCK